MGGAREHGLRKHQAAAWAQALSHAGEDPLTVRIAPVVQDVLHEDAVGLGECGRVKHVPGAVLDAGEGGFSGGSSHLGEVEADDVSPWSGSLDGRGSGTQATPPLRSAGSSWPQEPHMGGSTQWVTPHARE